MDRSASESRKWRSFGIQWKLYFVFGPCLYSATSRLIDIDISQLLQNRLIKPTLIGWHPECKPHASMLSKTGQVWARAMLAEQYVDSPGTAEVWRLPTINHCIMINPVVHRVGIPQEFNSPLFPKRVNFWHMHCSEKKSPLSYSEEERKNGLATHMGHRR